MEKPADNGVIVPEEPQEETPAIVSRRRLLKSLVISGGAVAGLTMLPEKWTRPVVEAGELSVHAEASPALRISDLTLFYDNHVGATPNGPLGSGQFDFEDYYAGVDDTATLHARISSNGTLSFDSDLSAGGIDGPVSATITNVSGAGETTGQVFFVWSPLISASVNNNTISAEFCIKLEAQGRMSNQLCKGLLQT